MHIKYLIIFSVISLCTLNIIGCSKSLSPQNNNQSESSKLYEQGSKYFLGKNVPQDYQKAFLISKWRLNKAYLLHKMI